MQEKAPRFSVAAQNYNPTGYTLFPQKSNEWLHCPEPMGIRVVLTAVNVNDQNRLVPDLVFNAETFDIDDSDTREVGQTTDFRHRGQQADLPVNHLHQLTAILVATVSLIEEIKDGLQTIDELRCVDDF